MVNDCLIHADGCSVLDGTGLFSEAFPEIKDLDIIKLNNERLIKKGFVEQAEFNRKNSYVNLLSDKLGINNIFFRSYSGRTIFQLVYDTIKYINRYKEEGKKNVLFVIGLPRITIEGINTIYGYRGILDIKRTDDEFQNLAIKVTKIYKHRCLLNALYNNILVIKYLHSELERSKYPFIITLSEVCDYGINELLNGNNHQLLVALNRTYLKYEFLNFHKYVEYFDVKKPTNNIEFLSGLIKITFDYQTKHLKNKEIVTGYPTVNCHKYFSCVLHEILINRYNKDYPWIK